jgi:hypothetical protein
MEIAARLQPQLDEGWGQRQGHSTCRAERDPIYVSENAAVF